MMNNNDLYDTSKKYNKPLYFLITAGVCLLIGIIVVIIQFPYLTHQIHEYIFIASDACFVSGVIVGGVGVLVLVSGEGTFDLLVYGFGIILKAFSKSKNHESFIDYKQRKEAERGNVKVWFIAVVGGIFVVLGIILSFIAEYVHSGQLV